MPVIQSAAKNPVFPSGPLRFTRNDRAAETRLGHLPSRPITLTLAGLIRYRTTKDPQASQKKRRGPVGLQRFLPVLNYGGVCGNYIPFKNGVKVSEHGLAWAVLCLIINKVKGNEHSFNIQYVQDDVALGAKRKSLPSP